MRCGMGAAWALLLPLMLPATAPDTTGCRSDVGFARVCCGMVWWFRMLPVTASQRLACSLLQLQKQVYVLGPFDSLVCVQGTTQHQLHACPPIVLCIWLYVLRLWLVSMHWAAVLRMQLE